MEASSRAFWRFWRGCVGRRAFSDARFVFAQVDLRKSCEACGRAVFTRTCEVLERGWFSACLWCGWFKRDSAGGLVARPFFFLAFAKTRRIIAKFLYFTCLRDFPTASGHRKKAAGEGVTAGRGLTNGDCNGESQHQVPARRRRTLRSSDPSLEPQDEAVHLRQPR